MWMCNRLDLQALGSQPVVMPKNFPDNCALHCVVVVEKCTSQSRVLDMVIWDKGWYARDGEKTIKLFYSSWSSPEVEFLVRGVEVGQETWPLENFRSIKCCHVGIHVQCSQPKDSRPYCKPPLDKSLALGQSNFRINLEFMIGGLIHRSVNWP